MGNAIRQGVYIAIGIVAIRQLTGEPLRVYAPGVGDIPEPLFPKWRRF